ncbi:MAG: hypothetical protein CVT89_03585 [Candidatus Altiarchaeales archaeon HGW-Altiarchaeales-2]|nr:MAG: hypothetical protein CVT89_03585 [Candidatus Altiarchaeales archaeon HGW-Altiarchaeales-2]
MNGNGKNNKTTKENFFEYLKYHPISGKLGILLLVGLFVAIIISLLAGKTYFLNIWQIGYLFLFWFPLVPIALKTRNKYAVYFAIAPFVVLLFFIVMYLFFTIILPILNINIFELINSMTKERPLVGALFILAIIIVPFMFFIYLLIKYQKSDVWFQSLWVSGGGVIVKTADKIYSTQDGYSERPYSNQMKISDLNFSDVENFVKLLAKNLIIINWKNRENSVKMWLLVRRSFIEYLDVFYSENIGSWIEINKDGKLVVFIAKPDYKSIYREVTYHTLCQTIAEKFEQSFVEFAKGSKDNKINAIKILKGEK